MRALIYMVLSVILMNVSLSSTARASEEALSREQCTILAGEIKDAEDMISNIKIESEAWVEKGETESGPWQRTPIYWSSTSWFDGNWSTTQWTGSRFEYLDPPKGKVRVDVHKQVLEWKEGAAPYAEESYSFGFDGQYVRYVRHKFGYNGKINLVKEGRKTTDVGNYITKGSYKGCTGIGFTLQFFDDEIYQFSKFAELAGDPNTKPSRRLKLSIEEFQGVECVRISNKFDNLMYWLDISHGFALRGKKSITQDENGDEVLGGFMKVTKLKEVAPGIWWPMEVSSVSRPYEPGKPWRRFIYCASNVIANDPNFDESVFTVPFPDGYMVDDKVTGKKYKVGQQ